MSLVPHCLRFNVRPQKGERVIWITLATTRRPIALQAPARNACLLGPLTWSHPSRRTDWGEVFFFLLTYFYFNALENPETLLFYGHSFPVDLSFRRLEKDSPPRLVGSGLSSARIFQGFCTSMLRGSRSYCGPATAHDTASAGWLRIKRAGHRGVNVGGASHNTAHACACHKAKEKRRSCVFLQFHNIIS